jgi:hypothetical protein
MSPGIVLVTFSLRSWLLLLFEIKCLNGDLWVTFPDLVTLNLRAADLLVFCLFDIGLQP